MPAEQVDAMLAAGPARRRYDPELAPVLELLRGLAGRPRLAGLRVDTPDLSLELRRGAPG